MKRTGHLIDVIVAPDNLRLAFWKAAQGKRTKADCRQFQEQLEGELESLQADLADGTAEFGRYHYFRIHDPKPRLICAAAFVERVTHHAVMNVCEPILERAAIFDSYACRKGKGRLAAVERAKEYARRFGWFLKMDMRKYFDSIDHSILLDLLGAKFKDRAVLGLFRSIIWSYETAPGKGLPIGNLTSQHFANFYLAPLDRFVKETLGRKAYVRYMDDCVVWADSGQELKRVLAEVTDFARDRLKLEIKKSPVMNRTFHGMDFLGYRIYPRDCYLGRRSKVRFIKKLRRYEQAFVAGHWVELQLQQRVQALLAFVMKAESAAFRRHVLSRFGVVTDGLEPRDPRGQLEQRRQELPVGVSQQQQPGQQEQQHRVPGPAGPSSIPPMESSGTDPVAILSCGGGLPQAKNSAPPGASSLAGGGIENSGRCFCAMEGFGQAWAQGRSVGIGA